MRLLFPALVLATAVSASAAQKPALTSNNCPSVTSHMANKSGNWRSEPLKPRKLGELPPADAFAAVYQLDERGCMVPVKYREVRGRR